MERKNDKYKYWWLYGAVASFLVAMGGAVLMYFFNPYEKAHADDDDSDRPVAVRSSRQWFERGR